MSEKKVNVKITASISEFEKAIKKAQKEVKELTDVLEDINKNKFGENLEKQFKDISDAAEKMQEQLEDMKDALDDIEKIKLDKVEKEFENIAEATEDLNDKLEDTVDKLEKLNKTEADKLKDDLEDTTEAAEDLNEKLEDTKNSVEELAKANLDKLEQQYKDVKDAADKLNEAVEDNQEALSELDKADMDKLRNSLENITESTEDLDGRFDDLRQQIENLDSGDLNGLEDEFEQVGSAIEDLGVKVRDAADDVDRHLNETLRDTKEHVEDLTDSAENMGDKLSKIDGLEDVGDNLNKLFDDKHIKVKLDSDGDNFLKNIAEDAIGTSIGTRQLSDSVQGIVDSVDKLVDSMRDMNQFTFAEQIKNYDDFINDMVEAQDEYNKALEESNRLQDRKNKLESERDAYNKLLEENANKRINAEKEWAEATKALEEQKEVVQNLEKAYGNLANADTGIQKLKDECEDARKEIERLEDEVKELGLSFKMDADGNKLIDTSNFEKAGRELEAIETKIEQLKDTLSRRSDFTGFLDKKDIQDEEIRDLANAYKQLWDEIKAGEKDIEFGETFEETIEEVDSLLDAMVRIDKESKAFGGYMQTVKSWFEDYKKALDVQDDLINKYYSQMSVIDDLTAAQDRYNKALEDYEKTASEIGSGDLDEERKKLEQLEDDVKKAEKAFMDLADEMENISNASEFFGRLDIVEVDKELKKISADMEALNEALAKGNKIAEDSGDAFNEQYKAYERLSKRVKTYLEDEEKSVLLREKVAKSFMQVSDAMEKVYTDSKKLNNADLINKTLEDATKYIKELDLVSTENLQADLKRLGEVIDDKTEKIKRFKELNKTFGSDDGKAAYGLEKEAEAIKEYADSMKFAVEAADTLKKAWGDISVGDEDHLKIRARKELLENYGKELEKTAIRIKSFYSEIQGPMTLDQKLTLDDYEVWEKSEEKLRKYNDAIQDYILIIKDANGSIDDRFLDEFGKFDISKFIEDFEKMGTTSAVLSKQFNANKIALQEWLKVEKEARKAAVENAKYALEQAKADEKAAKSQEELREATEKVAKAQEELADARKKLDNFSIDATKEVQELNELAEKLRKLGMAAEDLGKADVSKFDKSLASLMDSLDAFGDGDLPKTFSDFKEDIMAMFESLDSFDLGGVADGLKDIFSGIFSALPAEAKAVIAILGSVVVALDKLYEAGKRDFFEGLSKAGDALGKVADIARDVGQEVKDAFEDITGTNLDWSSLMALGPEFEYSMEKVGAIAGSNEQQLERLIKKAEELGGRTQYKASEVAEAFQYMAMAGYDTEQMLSSIDGTLALSIASGTDLAKTTDIVTDYMTALGLEANSTSDFVDKLAATITSSNTTVELFGNSMKQVASQAGSLGVSMTDLSTSIGLMANAGVKGSKSGTALKNILANLAAPTAEQAKALEQLGFTADETGSYLKTTADGNVDLAATMKQLMTATEGLDKTQRAALLTTIAGKVALPGLMAIISQGTEEWDELSATIENSTGKVQFWNECMSLAGKSGEEATKAIENMKNVFAEVEAEASDAGLSSEELSHAIAILGDDGKVASNDIRGLIDVISSMNMATGETEEKWRALDKAGDDLINTGYDYDATIAKLRADTTGLSQATKDSIEEQLRGVETYEEANKILGEYGLTAERVSFANETYADKLAYLRDNLKGCSDEEIRAQLANLGLADSFDEVLEVVRMTDDEFAQYQKNLEETKGMAESLAEAMDETTKAGLLTLASAIENVAIAAFTNLKPVINEAVDALNDFFDTWHNGESNKFTFDGFETALADITKKIQDAQPQIQAAIEGLFDNVDRFVNGGSLDSILTMAESIVNGICDGILAAEEDGTLEDIIDGLIQKISTWIIDNGPKIEKVGIAILEALREGIENNEDLIGDAMDVICDIIASWTDSSGKLEATAGKFAEQFVALSIKNMFSKAKNWISEKGGALSELLTGPFTGGGFVGMLANVVTNLMDNLLGVDPIGDAKRWIKEKFGNWHPIQAVKDYFANKKAEKGKDSKFEIKDIINLPSIEECIQHIKDWFNGLSIVQTIKDALSNKKTSKATSSKNIEPKDIIKLPSIKDCIEHIKNWFNDLDIVQAIKDTIAKGKKNKQAIDEMKPENIINIPSADEIKTSISEKLSGFNLIDTIKEKLFGSKKSGNTPSFNIKDIFDAEKLGTELGTAIGTLARKAVDAWDAFDTWGTELYTKGNEAAIKYSDGIRDFFIELPGKVSTWLSNTWNAVDTWGTDLYTKGNEAAIKYSDGIRDFFIELPGKISEWLTNAWSAIDTWGTNLYTKGNEAAIKYSDGIRDFFIELPGKISEWLSNAWSAIDTWGNNLYTKGSEAAIKYSDGIRDYFAELYNKISTWLSDAWKAVDEWGTDLYEKGSNAAIKYSDGLREYFTQLPGKISEWLSSTWESFTTWATNLYNNGKEAGTNFIDGILEGLESCWTSVTNWCTTFKESFMSAFKAAFGIHSPSTVMRDEIGNNLILGIIEGLTNGVGQIIETVGQIVESIKNAFGNFWDTIFGGNEESNSINIDTANIQETQAVLESFSTTVTNVQNQVRESLVSMTNIFTNQFTSMANVTRTQMVNISNIIRNQATTWSNIIRNQVTNARNAFTQQMISMASVARTQMVNVSNIIRNQAINWANIIRNQAKNARDAFTSQMMSMASVARTQMAKVLSTVRSYMSQIAAATRKTMTMNLKVNRSVNTSYSSSGGNGSKSFAAIPAMAGAFYAANTASTASLGANNANTLSARASSVSGFNGSSSGTRGGEEGQIIHTHVYLEGKEIARAAAKYMNGEIKTLNKREDRKRGVK